MFLKAVHWSVGRASVIHLTKINQRRTPSPPADVGPNGDVHYPRGSPLAGRKRLNARKTLAGCGRNDDISGGVRMESGRSQRSLSGCERAPCPRLSADDRGKEHRLPAVLFQCLAEAVHPGALPASAADHTGRHNLRIESRFLVVYCVGDIYHYLNVNIGFQNFIFFFVLHLFSSDLFHFLGGGRGWESGQVFVTRFPVLVGRVFCCPICPDIGRRLLPDNGSPFWDGQKC